LRRARSPVGRPRRCSKKNWQLDAHSLRNKILSKQYLNFQGSSQESRSSRAFTMSMFGVRCARTESHDHGRGSGKRALPCTRWCFAKCDRGHGCDLGMPWLTEAGRCEMLECAFEIAEATQSFIDGAPRAGEHVVYRDPFTRQPKRLQVVEWFPQTARVRFPGLRGDKLTGVKRTSALDLIVSRDDIKRVAPKLSAVELDYVAERVGIKGSPEARRKQVRFELRTIRNAVPATRLPRTVSFNKCLRTPDDIRWGAPRVTPLP
jgi:hypothetical protein